jgi:hypothetical protein
MSDFSSDGRLAPEEFATAAADAIHRLSPGSTGDASTSTTPEQVSGLFRAFDVHGDGKLNMNEFVLFVQWVMVSKVGAVTFPSPTLTKRQEEEEGDTCLVTIPHFCH